MNTISQVNLSNTIVVVDSHNYIRRGKLDKAVSEKAVYARALSEIQTRAGRYINLETETFTSVNLEGMPQAAPRLSILGKGDAFSILPYFMGEDNHPRLILVSDRNADLGYGNFTAARLQAAFSYAALGRRDMTVPVIPVFSVFMAENPDYDLAPEHEAGELKKILTADPVAISLVEVLKYGPYAVRPAWARPQIPQAEAEILGC